MNWCFALAPITASVLSSALLPGALGADSAAAPHLSPADARNIAESELRRHGENIARFKAGDPTFQSQERVWWVFLNQVAPPFIVDGDFLIVVDDASGRACMQQALAVSPCA
jgi:hypothetical protein